MAAHKNAEGLLVHLASYNVNLQGLRALPDDLVNWLQTVEHAARPADIIAIGFQELLPRHLGFVGFQQSVLDAWDDLIRSQLDAHASGVSYVLLAKVVNVGIAILVYARDDTVARSIIDLSTTWTGCGIAGWMGNKGAVGVRFRVAPAEGVADVPDEIYTFVNAHFAAHEHNFNSRLRDWDRIVGTLLFPSGQSTSSGQSAQSTLYETSHLFVVGDFNFRVTLPPDHPHHGPSKHADFAMSLDNADERERVKEYDQLLVAHKDERVFVGLREGEFWRFKCTYKYELGHVDTFNKGRTPSWTDRILYTTYTDSPESPYNSDITNVLYTSLPTYTNSDHKPVIALLLMPPPKQTPSRMTPPLLQLPEYYKPICYPNAHFSRKAGRIMDRTIGTILFLISLIGGGSTWLGLVNCALVGAGTWLWWTWRARSK